MKKEQINPTSRTMASWGHDSLELAQVENEQALHGSLTGISIRLRNIYQPSIAACVYHAPPLDPVHQSRKQLEELMNLFQGRGPLANKLREHAACNAILACPDTDMDRIEKRIKDLFDYSEHMVSLDRSSANDMHHPIRQYLCTYPGVSNDNVSLELVNTLNETYNEFGISFSLNTSTYNKKNLDWKVELENEFGVKFWLSCHHGFNSDSPVTYSLVYTHPNEDRSIESAYFLFKNDKEMVIDCLDKMVAVQGFKYKDHQKGVDFRKMSGLMDELLEQCGPEREEHWNTIRSTKSETSSFKYVRPLGTTGKGNMFFECRGPRNESITITRYEDQGKAIAPSYNTDDAINCQIISRAVIEQMELLVEYSEGQRQQDQEREAKKQAQLERFKAEHKAFDWKALTAEEHLFVTQVFLCAAAKLNGAESWSADSEPLWVMPIKLGMIRTVGSFKWVPNTDKYQAQFREEVDVETGEGVTPPMDHQIYALKLASYSDK